MHEQTFVFGFDLAKLKRMKNISSKSFIFFLILFFGFLLQNVSAQGFSINESPLPAPKEPINDFANVIDDAVEAQLNQKIKDFKTRTNPPVVLAVATVKTTGDTPIFEYSLAVARGWKIGSKLDDNPSALLFIAVDDRKYFTHVSKDLQDELPDGLAGSLQRQYLVPAFRQGNYTKGIADTIDAYIRTIEQRTSGTFNENKPETNEKTGYQGKSTSATLIFFLFAIIIGIIFIAVLGMASHKIERRSRNRWGGGFGNSGNGGSSWIYIPSGGGWDSGSSSSSSWGSSSSDWGGFGGGGDFDGGGAGGSW